MAIIHASPPPRRRIVRCEIFKLNFLLGKVIWELKKSSRPPMPLQPRAAAAQAAALQSEMPHQVPLSLVIGRVLMSSRPSRSCAQALLLQSCECCGSSTSVGGTLVPTR